MLVLTDKGPIAIATLPNNAQRFTTISTIYRKKTISIGTIQTARIPNFYFSVDSFQPATKLYPITPYNLITENGNFPISWSLYDYSSLDTYAKVLKTSTVTNIDDAICTFGKLDYNFNLDTEYWNNTFLSAVFGDTKEVEDKIYVKINKLYLCHKFSQLLLIRAVHDGSTRTAYYVTFSFDPESQSYLKTLLESWGYTDVTIDYVRTDGNAIYQHENGDLLNGEPIYVEVVNSDEVKLSVEPIHSDAYIGERIKYTVKYKYKNSDYPGTPSVTVATSTGINKVATAVDSNIYEVIVTELAPKDSFVTFYDTVTNKTVSASINVINGVENTGNNSPYLPQGGGISGGGAQSSSSNVIGSFDGTPGPSVAGGIPDGAVGSDIASSGMYTKYLCDGGLLNVIAQYLWEDNVGIQALKAIIGNPIDSIISLISYPFALNSLVPVTSTKIYFGKYNSLLSASAITKSSLQIDWGTVEIPFFWGGFLDYSPYTQIQLYLPWGVGFVSLDPNEVMPWSPKNSYMQGSFRNGSVRVVTNIELDKGSCVHNVIGNNGRVIGSFGGICGKQVPVVGTNDAARTLALIGAAVSAGTTLGMTATGQPALGKGLAYGKNMSQMNRAEGREMLADYNSAVSGMLASSKAAAKSPPTYPRAGTFSDATSHLTVQYPYLIISRPSQSMPEQYGRFMGYPSNIFHNHLGEVKGYTEVSSIHLDNIPATSTELDELESILKGGVLL